MTEYATQPFTSYNGCKDEAPVLVGNWYEERVLQDTTGVTRCQATGTRQPAAGGSSIYTLRQDDAPELPTFPRVMEHTQQLAPKQWKTHARSCYQPSEAYAGTAASYIATAALGPRAAMELKQLMEEASSLPQPAQQPAQFETTHRTVYTQHSLQGRAIGARVTRDQDGRPITRDVTFLAETKLIPRATADRLMRDEAIRAGATQTMVLPDDSVPITIYSEAAARGSGAYAGTFYGTGTLHKTQPFNRQDNFTKLMGDPNKNTDDQ